MEKGWKRSNSALEHQVLIPDNIESWEVLNGQSEADGVLEALGPLLYWVCGIGYVCVKASTNGARFCDFRAPTRLGPSSRLAVKVTSTYNYICASSW
jgi:hypothetical protein